MGTTIAEILKGQELDLYSVVEQEVKVETKVYDFPMEKMPPLVLTTFTLKIPTRQAPSGRWMCPNPSNVTVCSSNYQKPYDTEDVLRTRCENCAIRRCL